MENVRPILVNMYAFNIFSINISSDVLSPLNDKHVFTSIYRLSSKY